MMFASAVGAADSEGPGVFARSEDVALRGQRADDAADLVCGSLASSSSTWLMLGFFQLDLEVLASAVDTESLDLV